MDELLAEMERCLQAIHEQEEHTNMNIVKGHLYPSSYQSCIRRNGKPLLPPLMTEARRIEMKRYKEAALRKETELETRRRHMSIGEEDNTHYQAVDSQTSTYTYAGNRELTECYQNDMLVANRVMTRTDEIYLDTSVDLPDNSHQVFAITEGDTQQANRTVTDDMKIETSLSDGIPPVLMDSLQSTASSSDISALNQTVINLSDLPEQSKDEAVGIRVGLADPTGEGDEETERIESVHEMHSSQEDRPIQDEDQGPRVPQLLQQSFSDTESFISFVGEYNKLPTPTPSSSTPEVSDGLGSVLDIDDTSIQANTGRSLPAKGSNEKGGMSVDFTPEPSPGTMDHSPGVFSTMDTNVSSLGSLGQSCTLPISVTESCDSTLADISERLDTPSIMEDISNNKMDAGSSGELGGGRDNSGSGTDSSIPSTVRRGPVGQEADRSDEDQTNGSQKLASKDEGPRSTSGETKEGLPEEVYSSPVRHVRRNSYTLDIASPALLAAKARNEAPEAPFATGMDDEHEPPQKDGGTRRQDEIDETSQSYANKDKQGGDVAIDEVTLVSQLELLEEIKQRLATEQRQQLEELLQRQKREQWLLEREMTDVQRRVTESRASEVSERDDPSWSEDDRAHSKVATAGMTGNDDPVKGPHNESRTVNSAAAVHGSSPIDPIWSPTAQIHAPKISVNSSTTTGWFSDGYKESASVQDSLERDQFQDGSGFGIPAMVTHDYGYESTSWIPAALQRNEEETRNMIESSPPARDLHRENSCVQLESDIPSAHFTERGKTVSEGVVEVAGVGSSEFYLEYGGQEKREEMRDERINDDTKQQYSRDCDERFDLISAAAKGFLTRRVMSTLRVQEIVKTIKDSMTFIFKLQMETPIKGGNISTQDAALVQRILNQLRAAKFELHDIFHSISPESRIAIIQQDRETQEQFTNRKPLGEDDVPSRPLSAATIKAIERRKRAKEVEKRVLGSDRGTKRVFASDLGRRQRKTDLETRSKSAPYSRVLKQLQGHEAPSFPTRPVSSAAYRSSRINDISRSTSTNNKIKTRDDAEQKTRKMTSVKRNKQENGVRRVLYPATSSSSSKKKITRKQAPRKPFKS